MGKHAMEYAEKLYDARSKIERDAIVIDALFDDDISEPEFMALCDIADERDTQMYEQFRMA